MSSLSNQQILLASTFWSDLKVSNYFNLDLKGYIKNTPSSLTRLIYGNDKYQMSKTNNFSNVLRKNK